MEQHDLLFDAPAFAITKSYRDDNGQMFVEGIASTVDIDLTQERMSPEAIAKMAARAVGIPLRSEHGKGWDDKLGEIVKADVISDDQGRPALWIKAKLYDWSSKSRDLFGLLKSGAKMGFSVAGKIKPGGIIKELAEGIGKYVPTYKDVDLTEVSVTDHPANLAAFCVAVEKSLDSQMAKQPDIEPVEKSEEPTLPITDFLDTAERKFPIDEPHLLPALRYFNQDGRREENGYDPETWAAMGSKLASRVNDLTGNTYSYNPNTETVTNSDTQKSQREEVNDMKNQSKLAANQVSPAVASFAKEWGSDISDLVVKTDEAKTEDVEKADPATSATTPMSATSTDKADSSSSDSSSSDSSTSSGSDSSSSDGSSSSSDSSNGVSSSMQSLLSDIASSLSTISSMSSGSSSSSDSSSSDSSTSTGSSTSTDKAVSSVPSTSSSAPATSAAKADDGDMMTAVTNLGKAVEQLKALMEKAKKPAVSVAPTDTSTTTATAKALDAIVAKLDAIEKSQTELRTKIETAPAQRKGYALAVRKSFDGHTDGSAGDYDQAIYEKMKSDMDVTIAEQMNYKDFGVLPKKYAQAQN